MQGREGKQIVSLSTSQRGGEVIREMRDLAYVRVLPEVEGKVMLGGDKISSFSSSFFPHFSPAILNVCPCAVGRVVEKDFSVWLEKHSCFPF